MKLKTFARRAAAAGAVLAALTLAALPALAAPKVQVSTTNAVADHADILSDETEQYVNDVSIKLSDACGAQIGVYTLDELLGSTTMEGFAYDVFNAWGLGSDDLDNGVLLLLAPNEADGGDYYIMRGDGLESQLSFSTLGSLLDEYMEPYWVNGDYDTGTQKTVQALANRLCSIYGVTLNSSYTDTSAPDRGGPNVMGFVLLVVAVLLVIWLITYLMRPRGPRPPRGGGGGSNGGSSSSGSNNGSSSSSSSSSSSTSSSTSSSYTNGKTDIYLQLGSSGSQVKILQNRLIVLGYLSGTADGEFAETTQAAVIAFQKLNGLDDDGIAGAKTQTVLYSGNAKRYDSSSGSSSGGSSSGSTGTTVAPNGATIQLLHWFDDVKPTLKNGQNLIAYDPDTGISWTLRIMSRGNHADVEPLTAADTAAMFQAFGNKESWGPKVVYIKLPDGRWSIASTHNVAHGSQTISDNNFDGQNCVHFLRDMDECKQNDPDYGVQNQEAIREAWKKLTGITVD